MGVGLALEDRLRDRSTDVFEQAVRDAVLEGPSGEAALAAVFGDLRKDRRLDVVVALGDAQGTAGPGVLRAVLASADASRDMRCAAVSALAKRCGVHASADLATALASRDPAVKQCAMLGLAYAGDDRAVDAAFARFRQLTRGSQTRYGFEAPHLSVQSPTVVAVFYLARHLDGTGGVRTVRLVTALRDHWDRLPGRDRSWLAETWPDADPLGPEPSLVPPPDEDRLDHWIARDPLFGPAH
ncbi:HEAT repeat domain-containing protein [Yinghuangia seranimata]|uniref:HEAT repeat domain-containing protein n=1 Tax=Yinghuangia seranimata TaxID=408067 RepID=UPI00248B643B|nr:hypothetical protein [Yinghuangia seranimata]MDI2124686.1 hypothetical protein [Yinghuangia seranimata]